MIIDAKTIVLTLFLVAIVTYLGLKFVRKFALQIARENHDAILAMDHAEETQRLKRERAEAAEASAYAKVQPILTTPAAVPAVSTTTESSSSPAAAAKPTTTSPSNSEKY